MIRREPQLKQQFIKRPLETRVVSLVSVHPTVARTNNDDIAAGNKFCTKLFFAQYDARKADFRRRNPTSSSIAICKILKCQLLSNKIKSLFLKTFTTKRKLYFFQENAPTIELPSLGENKPVKCNGSHRSRDAKLPKRLLLYSVGARNLLLAAVIQYASAEESSAENKALHPHGVTLYIRVRYPYIQLCI
ncbi:uncharacterized protein LOC130690368 isoform X3 [Daphnia carinata]|uniref:uncharacterized protein LOC130690368 isoform X3 n=2 Tax=Daphnia carinata TaxID=120202 RepID=UPI00257AD9FF|nr:uncharacterized protein LOC130690368 isoform X3 [Daphnia carinata]